LISASANVECDRVELVGRGRTIRHQHFFFVGQIVVIQRTICQQDCFTQGEERITRVSVAGRIDGQGGHQIAVFQLFNNRPRPA